MAPFGVALTVLLAAAPAAQAHARSQSAQSATAGTAVKHTAPGPALLQLGDSGPAVLQLQYDLAKLGYLPETVTGSVYASNRMHFHPRYPHMPTSLTRLWQAGVYTTVTEGAVMTFEAAHNLGVDGIAGPLVRQSLAADMNQHRANTAGYTYVTVSETLPQTVKIWHNGSIVLTSLANTGVASAPTDIGTWPVYLRYQSQTMSGVTPWGVSYSDPGVPYVNYFHGGDAVHGFIRSHYGYPQSLGCVELPIQAAAEAWTWIRYGTLVTVEA